MSIIMPNLLNLDNTLSPHNAYQIVAKEELNIENISLQQNWLETFSKELNCQTELDHHIGKNSSYSGRQAILDALRIIYIYYHGLNDHKIDVNEQAAIKDKIIEGIGLCTPGFHNRINQIIMGFQIPHSIKALMMQYRTEIVSKLANTHETDVHKHNQYYLIANQIGKNVYVTNTTDPYHLFDEIEKITVEINIKRAFSQHYHPWAIILNVVMGFKNILIHHHDYKGFKSEGYNQGDFNEWRNYFAKLLNIHEDDIAYEDFFILNEHTYAVLDINWAYVREQFSLKLFKMNCFNLNPEQKNSLLALNQRHTDFLNFDIKACLQLIPNDQILLDILSNLSVEHPYRAVELYQAYIKRHHLNLDEQQSIISAIFKSQSFNNMLPIMQKNQPELFISELLREEGMGNGLHRALKHHNKTLIQCYVKILPFLYDDQREQIFLKQDASFNTPLMSASKNHSWAVKIVLDELKKEPELFGKVLLQVNVRNEHALSLMLQNNDYSSIKYLLSELTSIDAHTKQQLLSNINPRLLMTQTRASALIKTTRLLEEIKQKSIQFETQHPTITDELQKLHEKLSEHYEDYLKSADTEKNKATFIKNWQDEIQKAKKSPLIEHRAYKEIITIALLCLSIIGLALIIAKAAAHYKKEGDFRFFHLTKTNTEQCLDRLESSAEKMIHPGA